MTNSGLENVTMKTTDMMSWTSPDGIRLSIGDRETEIMNVTGKCKDNLTMQTYVTSVVLTCALPALFGNILIIVSYMRFGHFRRLVMYKFISNMAVSDMLMVFAMLLYPVQQVFPEIQRYKYFCLSRVAVILTSVKSSVFFLTLISIDRFLAIVFPLSHRLVSQKKRKLLGIIIGTWIISISTSLSVFFANNLDGYGEYAEDMPCGNVAMLSDKFGLFISVPFAIIMLLDFILYACVLRVICMRSVTNNSRGSAVARTKLMLIVHFTFLACWSPMMIGEIIYNISNGNDNTRFKCIREYLFLLALIKSCTNWIFYGILNDKFKTAFSTLLCCCRKDDHNVAVHTISS